MLSVTTWVTLLDSLQSLLVVTGFLKYEAAHDVVYSILWDHRLDRKSNLLPEPVEQIACENCQRKSKSVDFPSNKPRRSKVEFTALTKDHTNPIYINDHTELEQFWLQSLISHFEFKNDDWLNDWLDWIRLVRFIHYFRWKKVYIDPDSVPYRRQGVVSRGWPGWPVLAPPSPHYFRPSSPGAVAAAAAAAAAVAAAAAADVAAADVAAAVASHGDFPWQVLGPGRGSSRFMLGRPIRPG